MTLYNLGGNLMNLRFCHSSFNTPFLNPSPQSSHLSLKNRASAITHRHKNLFFSSGSLSIQSSMSSSTPSSIGTDDTNTKKPFSVLFVCLGNICRSPAAEGVFRHFVNKRGLDSSFNIDSAGTINYHEVC